MKPRYLLLICFVLQIAIWFTSNRIKPQFVITPYPPTQTQMQALSFGDTQFYYRKLGLELQNAGDKHGHYTSFLSHDYKKLHRWFKTLDNIDENSQYIPFMAAYYYSMVPDEDRVKVIADYILEYAQQSPEKHWRLLTTAAFMYHKYPNNNSTEALKNIGGILTHIKEIPLWARILSAFYLNDSGEVCSAYTLITKISQDDMLTNAENADDKFLVEILEHNIKKLQNIDEKELIKCRV